MKKCLAILHMEKIIHDLGPYKPLWIHLSFNLHSPLHSSTEGLVYFQAQVLIRDPPLTSCVTQGKLVGL